MKLFLITPNKKWRGGGYDTYDSAVVAAKSPEGARKIHPSEMGNTTNSSTWPKNPGHVDVEFIGRAKKGIKAGEVICASFHAG